MAMARRGSIEIWRAWTKRFRVFGTAGHEAAAACSSTKVTSTNTRTVSPAGGRKLSCHFASLSEMVDAQGIEPWTSPV
jgi:hypothetical protein